MKGYKFLAFEQYLKNCNEEKVELTFEEIEKIIGEKLSTSAYKHIAYWHLSETHTFPHSWLVSGFAMDKLDLKRQKVVFIKDSSKIKSSKTSVNKTLHTPKALNYTQKPEIEIDFAIEKAGEFLQSLNNDTNSRYLSWEHCYTQFLTCKELNEHNIDTLSLHLAFYLASWGMYRGSSFLLQKDYRVHSDAVKELYNPEYKPLWGISCADLLHDNNLDLVFNLSDKLKEIYIEKRRNLDDYEDISQILVTKILMGVLGCVPAYDRFFVDTIKTYKIASSNYGKKSLYDLALFYNNNREQLEPFRQKVVSSRNVMYPEMKILDMSFWYIGIEKVLKNTAQD